MDGRQAVRTAVKIGAWIVVIGAVVAVYLAFAGVISAAF